jgi:hypothetical protein
MVAILAAFFVVFLTLSRHFARQGCSITRGLMIRTSHKILFGDQIVNNEMGGDVARMGKRKNSYKGWGAGGT